MINSMRATISVFVLLLLVNSCTEQKIDSTPTSLALELSAEETAQSTATSSLFNKAVGSPIDRATALRWMANFAKANPSTSINEYFIQTTVLKQIISNAACVGVSLHYSYDGLGQLHIIPVGVGGSGKVIANPAVTIDNIALDWPTQQRWITNYTGLVRSHFFGTLTFIRLIEGLQAQTVRMTRAIDDSGNPQLLLSNANDPNPTDYEDKSYPCPPVCSN